MVYKRVLAFIAIIMLILSDSVYALSYMNVPYYTYNYDYWGNIYYTPPAYIPQNVLSGVGIGCGDFKNPQDIFVDDNKKLYIADTGNNRIVVYDLNDKKVSEIKGFVNNGVEESFKSPSGIYVTNDGKIYIADTGSNRVVALNSDGTLYKIIKNPESKDLGKNFQFSPLKVAVDYAGRVYVIAKNLFEGIMSFDNEGNFTGFVGTIYVNISPYEKIWRKLSTKAQRKSQIQFIPTEFTGIDITSDGFLYATNIDANGKQSVRKLNPKGQDIIKMNNNNSKQTGTLSGDLFWRLSGNYSGASQIIDVTYRDNGIYSILDRRRGRIFTYDDEGDLLYIFGGFGSQEGTFKNPIAIDTIGDEILVLDMGRGNITIFVPTEYGSLINKAVSERYNGDEASAVELWKRVIKLDSNFELAYVGVGKSYLASGENKEAMKYFKLGMDRTYYSIAYRRYRDDILKKNLGYILTVIIVLIAIYVIKRLLKRKKIKKDGGSVYEY